MRSSSPPLTTARSNPADRQPSRPVMTRGRPCPEAVAIADLRPSMSSKVSALTFPSSTVVTMTPSRSAVTTLIAPPFPSSTSSPSGLDEHLARGAALGQIRQRATDLLQGIRGGDVRGDAAGTSQVGQFGHIPRTVLGLVAGESLHGEPGDHDALEEDEVEGDSGNLPRGEPDRDEAATPAHRAQGQ